MKQDKISVTFTKSDFILLMSALNEYVDLTVDNPMLEDDMHTEDEAQSLRRISSRLFRLKEKKFNRPRYLLFNK